MNKQGILNEINQTKLHLADLEKKLKECKYERWKPKNNEEYWFVDVWNKPCFIKYDNASTADLIRYNTYNCFQTKEEAEAEAEKILVRRMLEDIARRLNKNEKIDWSSEAPRKYHLCIDKYGNIYDNVCYTIRYQGVVYCLDKGFKDVAIQEIGEERLKKYLRGE